MRREKLSEGLEGGLVVLFGAKSVLDAWEERRFDPSYRITGFRQEPNLYYLTGLETPGSAVTIDCDRGVTRVFVPKADERTVAEVERLGLGSARPLSSFEEHLRERARRREIHLLLRSGDVDSLRAGFGEKSAFPAVLPGGLPGTFPDEALSARFGRRFEPARIASVVPALQELRRVKDDAEIEALRAGAAATVKAFLAALPDVGPGVEAMEVAGSLQVGARRAGAHRDAFAPLVQAGADGLASFVEVVDSYDRLNRILEAGELALLDYGAELDYYVADVARTVPVSGRFSEDQRLAYEAYLEAYRAGLEALGPGRSLMEAARATAAAFGSMLPDLPGWLRPAAERFASEGGRFRPGHFLGLELHDHERYDSPLRPGEVVAYEHHFRIPERGWRITVEDMVLVTDGGREILTASLPRDPDALEALVGDGGGRGGGG